MNVASKELCEELYELSGWETPQYVLTVNPNLSSEYLKIVDPEEDDMMQDHAFAWPAYNLGYLLRKLPEDKEWRLWKGVYDTGYVMYEVTPSGNLAALRGIADTPEDAACKLAIELFKQGVLK